MKKFTSISLILISLLVIFSSNIFAQDESEESPLTVSATFVSNYAWRGALASASPNIQPFVSYTVGGLYVGALGSTDFAGEYKEMDLFVGYSFGGFSATIYDYYWSTKKYFDYKNETTGHIYELELIFEPEAFPITLYGATMLYGEDKKYFWDATETDLNKNNYSTYFEIGYTFDVKGNSLYPFIGITPFTGFYGENFNVINSGLTFSRDIQITEKFCLPVSASTIINPQTQNYFFVFGLTL